MRVRCVMTEKYNLTPENCTSYLVDSYVKYPEKLLKRIVLQFEFELYTQNHPEPVREKLKKAVQAVEECLMQFSSECEGCGIELEGCNGVASKKGLLCVDCFFKYEEAEHEKEREQWLKH